MYVCTQISREITTYTVKTNTYNLIKFLTMSFCLFIFDKFLATHQNMATQFSKTNTALGPVSYSIPKTRSQIKAGPVHFIIMIGL